MRFKTCACTDTSKALTGSSATINCGSAAKAKAAKSTNLAVREGVQMHGGMGMTDAYDIGLYMKRDRALNEVFGDLYFHADKLAKMNGY